MACPVDRTGGMLLPHLARGPPVLPTMVTSSFLDKRQRCWTCPAPLPDCILHLSSQWKSNRTTTHPRGPEHLRKRFCCYIHWCANSSSTAKQTRACPYPGETHVAQICTRRWELHLCKQNASTFTATERKFSYQNIPRLEIPVYKWWFQAVHKLQTVTALLHNAELVLSKQWLLLNDRETKFYEMTKVNYTCITLTWIMSFRLPEDT